jgi:hypothetical protein
VVRTIKTITISSNGKRRQVRALFDTGATINYLRPEVAAPFTHRVRATEPLKVGLGGKRHVLKTAVPLTVCIGDHRMPFQIFYVADLKKFDAIVGAFFMEQWGVDLDPKRRRLRIKRDTFELQEEF